jgi:membrane protein
MVDLGIDNLRPTSGIVNPFSVTSFTASSRSSFVYTALNISLEKISPLCDIIKLPVKKEKTSRFFGITTLIVRESVNSFLKNNNFERSAALASYGFFSLIPLLFFVMYVLGNYATSSQAAMRGVESLTVHMFPELNKLIINELQFLTQYKSTWGVIGLVMLLMSIIPFADTLRTAFAEIFKTSTKPSFIRAQIHNIVALFVILALVFAVVVFEIFYTSVTQGLLRNVPLLLTLLDIAVSLAILILFVFAFYRTFLPRKLKLKHLLMGSVVSAVLLILVRFIFSWFLVFNPEYGAVFGSLKAVFIITAWVYSSFLVTLFGAEVMEAIGKNEALLLKDLFLGRSHAHRSSKRLMKGFIRNVGADEIIFREGEPGKSMFFILWGAVSIIKKNHVIRVLGDEEYFGEMSMLLNVPRTATAVAIEHDTQLVEISFENFELILRENPSIVLAILKELALRLKITDDERIL